jgi:hypothetical protein
MLGGGFFSGLPSFFACPAAIRHSAVISNGQNRTYRLNAIDILMLTLLLKISWPCRILGIAKAPAARHVYSAWQRNGF